MHALPNSVLLDIIVVWVEHDGTWIDLDLSKGHVCNVHDHERALGQNKVCSICRPLQSQPMKN